MRLVLALLLLMRADAPTADQTQAPPIVITHVNLVNPETGAVRANQTMVITGDLIRAVGNSDAVPVPRGAREVDGRGGWLIPGLWDMHVHLGMSGRPSLALLVANGVTGVRDMGGTGDQVRAWRDSIAAGALLGPRIEMSGPIVENARWLNAVMRFALQRGDSNLIRELNGRIAVATPEEARAAVERIAATGATLVKVRTNPPAPAYFALLREAKARGLRVVGHPPERGPSLADASDSGQASIEHLLFTFRDGTWMVTLEALSPAERSDLLGRLRRNRTALVPTLIAGVGFRRMPDSMALALISDSSGALDPRRRFVSPALAERWRRQIEMKQDEGAQPDWNALALRASPYLRALDSAGVTILAGTDLGTPLTYPGFGLHDELALLVREGGLTPAAALRAATIGPARFFGREREVGTIAAGMRADLVLLTGNPLADIPNVGKIRAVVLGGRLLDRKELDGLLADVAAGH